MFLLVLPQHAKLRKHHAKPATCVSLALYNQLHQVYELQVKYGPDEEKLVNGSNYPYRASRHEGAAGPVPRTCRPLNLWTY